MCFNDRRTIFLHSYDDDLVDDGFEFRKIMGDQETPESILAKKEIMGILFQNLSNLSDKDKMVIDKILVSNNGTAPSIPRVVYNKVLMKMREGII